MHVDRDPSTFPSARQVIIQFDVAKFLLSSLLCTLGIIVPGWASTAERRFTVTEATNTVLFGGESSKR
jgi:hypothetical protein